MTHERDWDCLDIDHKVNQTGELAMSGRVIHVEIPFDDGDRACAFYVGAFGCEVMPLPEMGYTMVLSGPSGEQGPTEAS